MRNRKQQKRRFGKQKVAYVVILEYFSLLVSLEQTWAWHSLSFVVGQQRPQWHRDREPTNFLWIQCLKHVHYVTVGSETFRKHLVIWNVLPWTPRAWPHSTTFSGLWAVGPIWPNTLQSLGASANSHGLFLAHPSGPWLLFPIAGAISQEFGSIYAPIFQFPAKKLKGQFDRWVFSGRSGGA